MQVEGPSSITVSMPTTQPTPPPVSLPDVTDPAIRHAAVAHAAAFTERSALVDVLAAQTITRGPRASARLAELGQRGAVAVVTGQQAGLFGGPLLTLYKTASAIVVARALQAETGHPVVPVFWLQNEDHDFDEIAECSTPSAQAGLTHLTLERPVDPDVRRVSVAHRPLETSVLAALDGMVAALGDFPGSEPLASALREAYQPGRSVSAAFADLLGRVFEPYGLVIIDARDAGLARLAAPVHRWALESASLIADALTARTAALEAAGRPVQVHVRPGAPLAFFHPDGPEGPRFRLDPSPRGFDLVGRPGASITLAALLAAHDREPRCLSSSALLRPLIQDVVLPTAAYVGGPAELTYLAQTAPLYAAYGRPMPLIVPRAKFRLVEPRAARLLSELGLTVDALSQPRDVLASSLGGDGLASATDLEAGLQAGFQQALEAALPTIEVVDATLVGSARKLEASVGELISRFTARYGKARTARDTLTTERLDRLLTWLQPGGVPQERVHAFPYYLARYPEQLLPAVMAVIEPYTGASKTIYL